MKKKNNKKTIPAYAFGMDQLSNYLGGANVFGSAISGLSEEGSTGDVAGSTIGSAASLAGAGLTVGGPIGAAVGGGLGLVSGLIGSIKRKKQMQALRRRKETLNKTKIGMNAAAETEGEYWDDNDLAYTFENGGILPDLAYLDNNEVVRDDYGNIVQVPNTQPGTDNHLVDASTLESVLSDKIKRPGTKNTFAKEGQILSKMTKPSKGKDKFAENTNRLNKINANKAYNKLLAEQEAVKAAKGVKPKVKGIPAYEDGKERDTIYIPPAYGAFLGSPITGLIGTAANIIMANGKDWFTSESAESKLRKSGGIPYRRNYITGNVDLDYTVDPKAIQTKSVTTYPTVDPSLDMPTRTEIGNLTPSTPSAKPTQKITTTKSTPQYNFVDAPMIEVEDFNPHINDAYTQPLPSTFKKPVAAKPDLSPISKTVGKKGPKDKVKNDYSPDWLSLAPTVYNTLQSLRGPEEEPLALNPYAGAVRSTMARRRMNIEPARLANSRSRAISNYNLANINANTGANLAARTQAAVGEYASNADMYAAKQNADNAYLGEYANTLNNLGQQFVQSENMYNDLNARNRAAARNFGATATSQLGKWSQVNRQMQNQYNRDQMTLPFLADFLSQGFTKEQVDNLLTRTRNRV